MDDATVGRAMRALRMGRGWRQADLAAAAGVSQSLVSRAELGDLGPIQWATIRGLFASLGAGCSVTPWWRSGAIDRLLDEDHAMLVALAAEYLRRRGWTVAAEVSFAIYGERGSIDLLAVRSDTAAVLVVEVKSRLMSVEELLRTLDRKVRLAARIVQEREGWLPRTVGRLVVLGEDTTNRGRVARAAILDLALPLRSGALRAWLAAPVGAASGLLFLPLTLGAGGMRGIAARQRVRARTSRTNPAECRDHSARNGAEDPPGG